jgi:hypothetical protein
MYAWIWRHLPFGTGGRIGCSLLIVVTVTAGLWFGLFPVIEPIMPFNDGGLDNTSTSTPSTGQVTPSGRPTVAPASPSGAAPLPGDTLPSSNRAPRSSR